MKLRESVVVVARCQHFTPPARLLCKIDLHAVRQAKRSAWSVETRACGTGHCAPGRVADRFLTSSYRTFLASRMCFRVEMSDRVLTVAGQDVVYKTTVVG